MGRKFTNFPKLIGVIHLPPLPGAPQAYSLTPSQSLEQAGFQAIQEAKIFKSAGFDGIIIENFGDAPFYKTQVPAETVASLSVIAAAIREIYPFTIGINVLRNDALSSLAIASVTGLDFIRVNVLSGVQATDQGLIEGNAHELLRQRQRLNSNVLIFADVLVKHAHSLYPHSLEQAIEETAFRSLADAIIVSGKTTGQSIPLNDVKSAYSLTQKVPIPLYIGSGMNNENLSDFGPYCHGMIVSSSLRINNLPGNKLLLNKVKSFSNLYKKNRHQKR